MKFRFFVTGLLLALILQVNHIGLMHVVSTHGNPSTQCFSAQQTGSTERCFCCVIEQADTSASNISGFAPFTSVPADSYGETAALVVFTNYPLFESRPLDTVPKWLTTVVQRK